MKQNTKRETIAREEAQGTQIICQKPPTPKFVRAVIQVISDQFFALLIQNQSFELLTGHAAEWTGQSAVQQEQFLGVSFVIARASRVEKSPFHGCSRGKIGLSRF
jgi:hypothetical protein